MAVSYHFMFVLETTLCFRYNYAVSVCVFIALSRHMSVQYTTDDNQWLTQLRVLSPFVKELQRRNKEQWSARQLLQTQIKF